MRKYLLGLFKFLFYKSVSLFSIIDYISKISRNAKIYRCAKILESSVDDYSYIAPQTELLRANIGKFCSIGKNCKLGLPSHEIYNISTHPIFTRSNNGTKISWTKSNFEKETPYLNIGNDVWIGANVIIMSGLNIGNGVIIGAGAVVTKNIPPYAIVAGVPAKIIKYRFDKDIISLLEESKWWDMPETFLKRHIGFFQHKTNKSEIIDFVKEINKSKRITLKSSHKR